jgi:hypothetical protein
MIPGIWIKTEPATTTRGARCLDPRRVHQAPNPSCAKVYLHGLNKELDVTTVRRASVISLNTFLDKLDVARTENDDPTADEFKNKVKRDFRKWAVNGNHPDKGGDTREFQRVSATHDAFQEGTLVGNLRPRPKPGEGNTTRRPTARAGTEAHSPENSLRQEGFSQDQIDTIRQHGGLAAVQAVNDSMELFKGVSNRGHIVDATVRRGLQGVYELRDNLRKMLHNRPKWWWTQINSLLDARPSRGTETLKAVCESDVLLSTCTPAQIVQVVEESGHASLQKLTNHLPMLRARRFSSSDISTILSHGGIPTLEAVCGSDLFGYLTDHGHIVRAALNGGLAGVEELDRVLRALRERDLPWNEVNTIADGGGLAALKEMAAAEPVQAREKAGSRFAFPFLARMLPGSSQDQSGSATPAIDDLWSRVDAMGYEWDALDLIRAAIPCYDNMSKRKRQAAQESRREVLAALVEHDWTLLRLGFDRVGHIAPIAASSDGAKAVAMLAKHGKQLRNAGFEPKEIGFIAVWKGGARALEAVMIMLNKGLGKDRIMEVVQKGPSLRVDGRELYQTALNMESHP